jgi:glucose-6-phosphate isomerase
MSMPRCDRTVVAWAALQGHFEAHGRDLDLREAFAATRARFERLQPAGARGLCRPVEEPVDAPPPQAAARAGARVRLEPRATPCCAASPSTPPKAAPCCTPRCARRAAPALQRRGARRAGRMLAYAERCAPTASSGITDVVNIGIGGSDLGPQMVVPALDAFPPRAAPALRQQRRRPRHRAGAARLDARRTLFIVASKTFTTQETMANAQVARPGSWPRAAPTSAATSRPPPPT